MNPRLTALGILVLVAGMLFAAGDAQARTIVIPIEGSGPVITVDPGVQWTDADGITHIRDRIQIGSETAQDANGIPVSQETVYTANLNLDMVTGNGDYHAKAEGENTVYGDLSGSFRGNLQATISGFVMTGTYNYAHGYGDFDGWKHRGTWTSALGSSFVTFEGIFHVPGGGHGEKAITTEILTLSAVRQLFQ